MAISSLFLSSSPPIVFPHFNPKPHLILHRPTCGFPTPPLSFPPLLRSSLETFHFQNLTFHRAPLERSQIWKLSAVSEESLASETNSVETLNQIPAPSGDGLSIVIQLLLFVAVVGLSVLTIGVVYIGVTDFLQKREAEKFEKEEAATKKRKGGKRRRVTRAGPRGFGQKANEDDDYDDGD